MRFLLTFLLLITATMLRAQQDSHSDNLDGFGIELNEMAGKVLKHSNKFTLPIPSVSTATDIAFLWQTYGRRPWHQVRHYPVVGFGFTYTHYGIDSIYGRSYGLYTLIQIPLITGRKWEWTLRIGDGVSYVSKRYQDSPPFDTINVAIGTHINDFGIFVTDLRYHWNEHWDLQAGANFTHISNGDYRSPNLGVNMYGAHVSVRYFPTSSQPKRIGHELLPPKDKWITQVRLGLAYSEARTTGSPEVPTYVLNVYEGMKWGRNNKLFGGINYAYKTSVYDFLVHYGVDYGHEKAHSWDGAFFAGNEFLVGRVGIVAEAGIYYHQTYLAFVPFYEKLGGNLYLINRDAGAFKELFISTRLVTHGFVAEYTEFGLGVGI